MAEFDNFPKDIHPANYEMKRNPHKPVEAQTSPIDESTLTQLENMSKEALILLIQKVSGAMWGVGLKSKEQVAEAFKLKLAIAGMSERDMFKALPIMREWFDRELGKASQSIAMTVEDKGLDKISTERLLRLAAMMEEPIIIAPLPSKSS